MKMLTLKLTPKKIFGIILLLVGLIVISVTFVANRTGEVRVGDLFVAHSSGRMCGAECWRRLWQIRY